MLVISGCAGLAITDEDSGVVTTGKVAARVLLCPVTLCFSELGIAEQRRQAVRDEERAREQRQYRAWMRTLSPEQQERERDRQTRLDAALLQAWGMYMQTRPFHQEPVPGYQPPPSAPIVPLPPRSCTTQVIGDIAHTNCY
jgi:hypothetical protein